MFENNKKKIIIAAILLIVIIIVVLIIMLRPKPVALPPVNSTATTTISRNLEAQIKTLPPAKPQQIQEDEKYSFGLKQLAFSFTERLGSYSNHSGVTNLENLWSLSTSKMKASLDGIISRTKNSTSTYEGYQTQALSSNIITSDSEKATILVKTQRSRTVGDVQPAVFYQNIILKFIKMGSEWKVDEASWQ